MKNPMRSFALSLILVCSIGTFANAQQKITLEKIWKEYAFSTKSVPGFNFLKDGRHYSRLEQSKIQQYDLITGELVKTLFDPASVKGKAGFSGEVNGYSFSEDEAKILIRSERESIYRRSYKAKFFVYDRKSGSFNQLYEAGKQSYATFNPQASKVAFVHENNLYYKDLKAEKVVQVTDDGVKNKIINGSADWVYEEEFGFAKAFFWSPNGERLAYYRFDETAVPEFTMTNYRDDMYPEYETFKYPKVGEKNSKVDIYVFDAGTQKSIPVALGRERDIYVPRIKWTQDDNQLCVYKMNRHQNHLQLLLANARSGETSLMLEEKNKYYIAEAVFDNLTFLEDGKKFIWTSEKDGWHHIYLHDIKNRKSRQITKGDWEVTRFYGIDEKTGRIYYQAAEKSPMERQVYSIGLDGKDKQIIAGGSGWNSTQFSSTYEYYVVTHSTANKPSTYSVFDKNGKLIRVIEENKDIKQKQQDYAVNPVEFFSFETGDKVKLNGWMIKPSNFKANREYPVFMYVYGGPGSQTVRDAWLGTNYWWFQMLADQGYLIVSVDNRGTGGRGEEFKKMTYQQLGHYETLDQIEAAKYVGALPYADANSIGIFGWSYGGYMSSLCILKGNDVFKTAIAVAPVTNWKWYDTIYTERYMRTYQENENGYRENSPIYFADRLKGDYLLVHGMADDNVHFQNTAEMANALIAANKQFDTYFYPNRNHGIYGDNARLHLYQKMTDFVKENLRAKVWGKSRPTKEKANTVPRSKEKMIRKELPAQQKQLVPMERKLIKE
jgi:dipeptidyl-peptidase-4